MTTGHLQQIRMPSGWRYERFDRVAGRVKDAGRPELPPLSVYLGPGVVPRSQREDNHNQLGENLGKYLVVKPGDLVFNKLRTWQGGLGVSSYEGIVSPAYFVMRPNKRFESRFLHHLLRSSFYLDELTRRSKWMPPSQFDIPWEQLKTLPILTPPLSAQRAIANFLDKKTAAIDALIAKKERLIDLVQEKRQALITQAVTKGLDPSVPRKNSGIDWLGEIPAHWEVKKLRWLLAEGPKNGVSPPTSKDADVPTFSIAAVRDGVVSIREHLKTADIDPASARPFSVKRGDVLVMRGNGSRELVGSCGVVDEDPPEGCIYPDILIRLRPGDTISRLFLVALLNSSSIRPQVEVAARTAAGIWKISGSSLSAFRLPVPPREEQRKLEVHISQVEGRSQQLRGALGKQITLLSEYRQALISAAVTGKINVTTEAA